MKSVLSKLFPLIIAIIAIGSVVGCDARDKSIPTAKNTSAVVSVDLGPSYDPGTWHVLLTVDVDRMRALHPHLSLGMICATAEPIIGRSLSGLESKLDLSSRENCRNAFEGTTVRFGFDAEKRPGRLLYPVFLYATDAQGKFTEALRHFEGSISSAPARGPADFPITLVVLEGTEARLAGWEDEKNFHAHPVFNHGN